MHGQLFVSARIRGRCRRRDLAVDRAAQEPVRCQHGDAHLWFGAIFYVTPYAEEGRLYQLREDGQGFVPEQIWQSSLDTVTGSGVLVDGTLFAAGYRKNKWWMATRLADG